MGRLKELRKYVDGELNRMGDVDKRNSAIVRLYGVSLAATMVIIIKLLKTHNISQLYFCFLSKHHSRSS